jgi:hypothetical protein
MAFSALSARTSTVHSQPSPAFVEPALQEITKLADAQKTRLPTDSEVKLLSATSSLAKQVARGSLTLMDIRHYGGGPGLAAALSRLRTVLAQHPAGLTGSVSGLTLVSFSGSEALATAEIDFYDPSGNSAAIASTFSVTWKLSQDATTAKLAGLTLTGSY